jgi:hypothetical protein
MLQSMRITVTNIRRTIDHGRAGSIVVMIATALALSGIALAHHSNAMFDKADLRESTVTVREFQWTNPHVWIQVFMERSSGEPQEWRDCRVRRLL